MQPYANYTMVLRVLCLVSMQLATYAPYNLCRAPAVVMLTLQTVCEQGRAEREGAP